MLYDQIASNKRKSIFIICVFFLLMESVGAAVGFFWLTDMSGLIFGMVVALIVTVVYTLIMLHQSVSIVMKSNHATEISEDDNPQLWHIIEDMALVARVPMPRVFIVDDPSPNAFATGMTPDDSAIAVTAGLLKLMNREELEGVIGHEMSHIRNYDIRVQTIGLALTSAILFLISYCMPYSSHSDNDDDDSGGNLILFIFALVLIILAPVLAGLLQMALSRNREYLADSGSVELTRNPQGLISALNKLNHSRPMRDVPVDSAAMYISDPQLNASKKKHFSRLFDTHPAIEDRIERLENM